MAEKGFGVKEVNLIGASGTPTITSPNNLNLNAVNVAISTNVSIGGTLTVTGNVSVGGTLTYEDVTNIDSVGVVTARNGLNVSGGNVTIAKDIDVDGHTNLDNVSVAGVSTFAGDVVISSATPKISLNDTNNNPDYDILNTDGTFQVNDTTNGAVRFRVKSAGQVDILQNLDVGSNIKLGNAGVVTATSFSGSGANLTGIAVTEAPVVDYTITSNGSSAYRFHGGGVDETADDPDLYLIRGQKYRFNNTTGSGHPFAIRVSNGGSAYTDGVSGNNQGVQFFTVPYDAPASLVYQCTIHGGMVGNIYIRGGASTANISNNSDNRVITGGSGGNLNGEANLTFNGSTLAATGAITATGTIETTGSELKITGAEPRLTFTDTDNNPDFQIWANAQRFSIYDSTNSATRLRIDSSGRLFTGDSTQLLDSTVGALHISGGTSGGRLAFRGTTTSANTGLAEIFAFWDTNKVAGVIAKSGTLTSDKDDGSLHFYTNAGSGVVERLRIDSDGKFCFGTYTNGYQNNDSVANFVNAASSGTENPLITLWNPTTAADARAGIDFLTNAQSGSGRDGAFIRGSNDGTTAKAHLQFGTIIDETYTKTFELQSTGAVEISSSNGNNLLKLTPTASASTSIILNTWQDNSNGRNWAIRNRYTDHGRLEFMRSTANNNDPLSTTLSMDRNGNVGAPSGTNIYNASDSRLKKNVESLSSGLNLVKQLRPVSFNWIDGFCDDEKETMYGFIAQEVETVDSNLIEKFGNGSVEVGGTTIDDTLRVKEKHIIAILVKAIQELSAEVAVLKAK